MTTPAPARSGPSLRGLGWGVLALVVVAVVLFAAVLGLKGQQQEGAATGPTATATADPPVGPDGPPLVGGWSFDEGSGPTAAAIAGDNPVVLEPGAEWAPDGRTGSAVHFDGTMAYGETAGPAVDTSGSFTVAAWVRLDRFPATFGTAVSQDGDVDSGFFLQYVQPDQRWGFAMLNPGGVGVRALSNQAPQLGRWTHLVGVRDADAGRLTLYVDGVEQGFVVYGQRPVSNGPLAVGRARFGSRPVDFLPGSVDGVRVYAGVLSPAEVRAVYESGR